MTRAIGSLLVLAMLARSSLAVAGDGSTPRTSGAEATRVESPSKALPIALLTIGGLAVAGGAVAIVLDEDAKPAPPGEKQQQFYYDSAPAGVLAIAGGGLFASIGGYLLWKHTGATTAPSFAVHSRGASVGFSGQW